MIELDTAGALDRARRLGSTGDRIVLGLTGPPGAGKSTLAAQLATGVPGAVVVGMDGFHLAGSALARLGRTERKGAIDTFDAAGYVALLERLRAGGPDPVWAPEFRREIEEPIGSAVEVAPDCALVITEGNYLLAAEPPWHRVAELCHEIWYLDLAEEVRRDRLTARHRAYGRSADAALRRTLGPDLVNAEVVAATRPRTSVVVRLG
ncbi:nucleoside/nucleotide kinase family protein [Naumannella huperziae]